MTPQPQGPGPRSAAPGPQSPAASPAGAVLRVEGRALPLRGDDIDTDRIMPARFLKSVSFDDLERHLFEDDRRADAAHAFNESRFAGASILIVNANFGCGSSREHAPQGLVRAGYRAIIGESFSEIFLGNAAMLGVPCFVAARADVERLQAAVDAAPGTIVTADVASGVVIAGTLRVNAVVPPALRDGFLSGQWNPTMMLLERFDEVRAVAARLPYIRGF
jgi:3-isopropylmalate/(R)-2-methylmalate dehydratase small subunit